MDLPDRSELADLPDTKRTQTATKLITMSCIDPFIVLEVNGIGAAHVTDNQFSSGDVRPGRVGRLYS